MKRQRDEWNLRGECGLMSDEIAAVGRVATPAVVAFDVPAAPAAPLPAVPTMPANFVPPAPDEHLHVDAEVGAATISG